MTRARLLPYGRQAIDDDDIAAVAAALRSDFLTTGPRVEKFERAFAEATGAAHAVACNSGTAALHLSTLALDLTEGDAAIVPSLTFLATANCVRMTGAEVVFADVDADTGLLTADGLAAAIEAARSLGLRVRAALPVHLNGQVCDMQGLASVAAAAGIQLVEDACHALGVSNIGAGNHSVAACFSTHPVKAIATGEGGVVTSSDAALAQRMRRLRSHGMTNAPQSFKNADMAFDGAEPNPWYYEMPEIGWNYRMPDILCELGISQINKLPRFFRRRQEIAAQYDQSLAPLFPLLRPVPHAQPHGLHLYPVLVDYNGLNTTRAKFMKALRAVGVGTQVHYIPVHHQPYYRDRYGRKDLPGADAYYARCLSIPMYPAMTDDDVQHVAASITGVLQQGAA